jgi:hypothetical protein
MTSPSNSSCSRSIWIVVPGRRVCSVSTCRTPFDSFLIRPSTSREWSNVLNRAALKGANEASEELLKARKGICLVTEANWITF